MQSGLHFKPGESNVSAWTPSLILEQFNLPLIKQKNHIWRIRIIWRFQEKNRFHRLLNIYQQSAKGLMEQSNREVMVHSFLPARSSYLRFTTVDRSVNENNHILIYVVFKNTVLLFYLLHCSFNIFNYLKNV